MRVETHNYRRSREHGVAVTSWIGTYGLCVIKQGGVYPDDVQHGGVPILHHRQARDNLGHLGCHTARNSANTVVEQLDELSDIETRWMQTYSRISFRTKRTLSTQQSESDTRSKRCRVPDLITKCQEVVVHPQAIRGSKK